MRSGNGASALPSWVHWVTRAGSRAACQCQRRNPASASESLKPKPFRVVSASVRASMLRVARS
eukprot:1214343-Rhodomonas_salina.1